MNGILLAVLMVGIVGIIGGVLLVAASRIFAVTEDQKAQEVELVLPGANCGGCGFAGCADYAKAIVEGAPVNLCVAGGSEAAEKIAAIMGVEAGEGTAYKAMIACRGDQSCTKKRYEYHGIQTCAACNMLYNGDSSCPYGCLGFGDCARACKFGAIEVVNGLSQVNPDKCTGCGACKAVCPKKIIFMYAYQERPKPIVMCSNHKKGADTHRECTAGCIGCGKCVKDCPVGAMVVRGNVARVDYTKCIGCGKCAKSCPVGAIRIPEKYEKPTEKKGTV